VRGRFEGRREGGVYWMERGGRRGGMSGWHCRHRYGGGGDVGEGGEGGVCLWREGKGEGEASSGMVMVVVVVIVE